jgi:hypothetical protein
MLRSAASMTDQRCSSIGHSANENDLSDTFVEFSQRQKLVVKFKKLAWWWLLQSSKNHCKHLAPLATQLWIIGKSVYNILVSGTRKNAVSLAIQKHVLHWRRRRWHGCINVLYFSKLNLCIILGSLQHSLWNFSILTPYFIEVAVCTSSIENEVLSSRTWNQAVGT